VAAIVSFEEETLAEQIPGVEKAWPSGSAA
jgi:hypothetical protein